MKSKNDLLALISSTAFGLFLLFGIGFLFAVIYDNDYLQFLCGFFLLIFALAAIIALFIALFRRRWLLAIVNALSIVAMAVVTFLGIILLAAGQYRPPHYGPEVPEGPEIPEVPEELAYQTGKLIVGFMHNNT